MGFYGVLPKESYTDSIDNLYNNFSIELENFSKFCNSIDVLNENGIILEFDKESFKEKLKEKVQNILSKFGRFILTIIEKIVSIANNISNKIISIEIKKKVDFLRNVASDINKDISDKSIGFEKIDKEIYVTMVRSFYDLRLNLNSEDGLNDEDRRYNKKLIEKIDFINTDDSDMEIVTLKSTSAGDINKFADKAYKSFNIIKSILNEIDKYIGSAKKVTKDIINEYKDKFGKKEVKEAQKDQESELYKRMTEDIKISSDAAKTFAQTATSFYIQTQKIHNAINRLYTLCKDQKASVTKDGGGSASTSDVKNFFNDVKDEMKDDFES